MKKNHSSISKAKKFNITCNTGLFIYRSIIKLMPLILFALFLINGDHTLVNMPHPYLCMGIILYYGS
jgi:hypothetical protein